MKLLRWIMVVVLLLGVGCEVAGAGVATTDIVMQEWKSNLIDNSEFSQYQTTFANWDELYGTVMIMDGITNLALLTRNILVAKNWIKFKGSIDNMPEGAIKTNIKAIAQEIESGVVTRFVITENLETLNGVKAFRMSKGLNSEKVIVIGRNMDDVRLYKQGLESKGLKVEIFDGDVIPQAAIDEFADFKNRGIWVNEADLPNTIMYNANKEWVERMVAEGYDIYDIGNLHALAGDGLADGWYSAFYEMERSIVFP
jgi:hypothetical protein